MPTADRDKVRALGPITSETLKKFSEQGKDPFKLVADAVKTAKDAIGKAPMKSNPRVRNIDAFKPLVEVLNALQENASLDEDVRQLAAELSGIAQEHDDSHSAMKNIETQIKIFKKAKKAGGSTADAAAESEAGQ